MPSPKSILLVEDDEAIRFGTALRLRANGYEVHTADNGRQAITSARQHYLDMILMDIRMPELDGLSALRALKADPLTASVPVIIASASSEDESGSLDSGAAFFLCKPYANESLLAAIRSVL